MEQGDEQTELLIEVIIFPGKEAKQNEKSDLLTEVSKLN